jgi:hypothetical protein
MKLSVVLLAGSAAINVALLATLLARPALVPAPVRALFPGAKPSEPVVPSSAARRAPSPAPTAPLWTALETSDLPTLISRLRAAGFPPAVISAVLGARIEAQFSARMRALASTLESVPFWRPSPTSYINNTRFNEERTQIYRERTRLLRQLLGDDFLAAAGGDATAAQIRQYGNLPKSKITLIERINDDYAEMASQVRSAANGIYLPEDREKLALLEREKRADLAGILSPQELEDYEMRSSLITMRLRSAMTWMDASEDEFRAVFRVHQQLSDPLEYTPGAMRTAMSYQDRQDRDKKMADAIVAAIGEKRAAEFERSQSYDFQQLARLVQRENGDLKAAVAAFDLRTTTAAESMRIRGDSSLSADQKMAAMQTLAKTTKDQLTQTLGAAAATTYFGSANWLQAIESGRAVAFSGRSTSFYSVAPSPAPAPTPRP